MSPVGFEPTIPASERPQTHALDRAATEASNYYCGITCTKSVCLHQTDKEEFTPPFHRMVYKISGYNCLQQIYMFFHTHLLYVYLPDDDPVHNETLWNVLF